jgi:hypothetical protein
MDGKDDRQLDSERDEQEGSGDEHKPGERDKQSAAAASTEESKGPEQDETDSTTWDTDQHSDAPGPFGTG